VKIGMECEIAVRLSRDLPPQSLPYTRETVAPAVAEVMAAIELVDERYENYRTLGIPTLVADDFFNAGCVLGKPVSDWRHLDLAALTGRAIINDIEVGRGVGAMVLGHPLNALAWLANAQAEHGLPGLKAGEFVMLGILAVAVLAMGLYPKPFTDVMHVSVTELLKHVAASKIN
jgi:2-oxo-3-hexenedioate decarboxylase/2-keto-4-pentenoate hydratase